MVNSSEWLGWTWISSGGWSAIDRHSPPFMDGGMGLALVRISKERTYCIYDRTPISNSSFPPPLLLNAEPFPKLNSRVSPF